jgi:lipid-A-disaccharide synthase
MFVAGDPSGDMHASHVIHSLRQHDAAIECYGVGGRSMAAAGLRQILPFEPFNCMGFVEVVRSLPFLWRAKQRLVRHMRQERPAALVLVDYASFNIPLMKAASALHIPVVWYIAPKVWAWKEKRASILGCHATTVATIFPFEVKCFEGYPAKSVFVGNPLVEELARNGANTQRSFPRAKPKAYFKLAIIPGSRRQEVRSMLGPMLDACNELRRSCPQMRAVVSRCPWLPGELYERCRTMGGVDLFEGSLHQLLAGADLALVTSGTATLETALRGVPHVIAYRTSGISYNIYRSLIKVPFIGLPNIVAGERIVPECIQDEVIGTTLANQLKKFVDNRAHYMHTVRRLELLRDELGSKRPSEEVARLVIEAMSDVER